MDNHKSDMPFINAAEFIPGRLYFVSIDTCERPKSTPSTHYFSIDQELAYESFFNDFGPLNISMLYHYTVKLHKKLKSSTLQKKKIVHYTNNNEQKRVNAAFLIASYSIIYLDHTPQQTIVKLNSNNDVPYMNFRDASMGIRYTITLFDCLNAIQKARCLGFFNFSDFDYLEYEHYERVENGDLNWIVPNKFIGFCGPHNRAVIENGYPLHSPEAYFSYFRRHNVTAIVRLNKKVYDAAKFVNAGFAHVDLYFVDGSTPSDRILEQFITLCEKTEGAIAVHCKAGLGRTGSLIGCYIMKHYGMTARETIAWIRICRPGSIIGHQQEWLESKQEAMWEAGRVYMNKLGITEPPKHIHGIYSYKIEHVKPIIHNSVKKTLAQNDNVSGIQAKVDTMQLDDKEVVGAQKEECVNGITQGDKLNQIKAQRRQTQHVTPNITERKIFRSHVMKSPIIEPTSVLRGGKVFRVGMTNPAVAASKSLEKRNEAGESQGNIGRCRQHLSYSPSHNYIVNGKMKPVESAIVHSPKEKEAERTVELVNGERKSESKISKRGKRCLEKDKISSPSVKVLRRSYPPKTSKATIGKLHFPRVKLTTNA